MMIHTVNIDTMPAGREMDALVAEKVMGLRIDRCLSLSEPYVWESHHGPQKIPNYSTSIAPAWGVREMVSALGLGEMLIYRRFDGTWVAYQATGCADYDFGDWSVIADTAPLAICRAALKACEVNERPDRG